MKLFKHYACVAALGLLATLAFAGNALAASPPGVGLGTTRSFAVLAHTGVTDALVPCCSTINGDLGNDQNIATTGTPTLNGTSHVGDGVAATARGDLNTAYNDAAGRTPNTTFAGADNQLGLAGTLVAGVYRFGHGTTANLIGNLTLTGSASDVWIFQATSDLVTAVGSSISFAGGAQACNVYWQVATSATLNGGSFAGTVMASTSITIGSGVTLAGRALAYTGDVTLIRDTITASGCAATSSGAQPPGREIYCDANGQSYDLVAGEDKLYPYGTLGLVPAAVDPLTGAKSCTVLAITPTPTSPTPTPAEVAAAEAAAAQAAATKATAAKAAVVEKVKAAKAAAAKKLATAKKVAAAKKAATAKKLATAKAKGSTSTQTGHARTARRHVGFTG